VPLLHNLRRGTFRIGKQAIQVDEPAAQRDGRARPRAAPARRGRSAVAAPRRRRARRHSGPARAGACGTFPSASRANSPVGATPPGSATEFQLHPPPSARPDCVGFLKRNGVLVA
jgi:hypothetical protein